MSEFSDFFLKEKPVRALVMLHDSKDDSFCGEVSQGIDSTYAHTVKIISKLEEMDLIETKKVGRKKMIKVTPRGQKQAKILTRLLDSYEESYQENNRGNLGQNDVFS